MAITLEKLVLVPAFLFAAAFPANASNEIFPKIRLKCHAVQSNMEERIASVDEIEISNEIMKMTSKGNNSGDSWIFRNDIDNKSLDWVDKFTINFFRSGVINGGGIRASSPYAFELVKQLNKKSELLTFVQIEKGNIIHTQFLCTRSMIEAER